VHGVAKGHLAVGRRQLADRHVACGGRGGGGVTEARQRRTILRVELEGPDRLLDRDAIGNDGTRSQIDARIGDHDRGGRELGAGGVGDARSVELDVELHGVARRIGL
jgi:hypothetical protein